jgi:hypothetical protein
LRRPNTNRRLIRIQKSPSNARRNPAELKLVIAGNHDLSLDENYWKSVEKDEQAEEKQDHMEALGIMTGKLAEEAGVTYLREGMHTFTLKSRARFTLYASPYQPKFGDWAFGYERDEDRFNTAAPGTTLPSRICQEWIS